MELIVLTQNGKTLGINLSVSISREHFLYSCKYFFFFFFALRLFTKVINFIIPMTTNISLLTD